MRGTPRSVLADKEEERLRSLTRRRQDGVVVAFLKAVFSCWIWHRPYQATVEYVLRRSGQLDRAVRHPHFVVHRAADVYTFGVGAALVASYVFAFAAAWRLPPLWAEATLAVLCLVPLFRLLECLSVIVILHANGHYWSPAPMRSVSRTIWTYVEFVLIFATFYVGAALWAGDTFRDPADAEFLESWATPLYFSMMTISTVGYGDFQPQTTVGRGMVALEVFCGIVLVFVALQRAMATIPADDS
ncbi:MAG TPA: potassium channel family protein [Pirellulales bacterium]